ncbi:MAG: sulfatase-like hydrolase/transferase [Verrucomicrobia bacterium]|nr:MAG: sulfatase-like hydrolase/transferase [Verrucomicrobiota bacterium]
MNRFHWLLVPVLAAFAALRAAVPATPNIVLVVADDLGWGDASCYGGNSLKTPRIDRLAHEGLRFTDAHSTSATCTPSRYALLTGEYPWRRPGTGILPGDAPLIIEPGRPTLPARLKRAGYATGVVGKWHLGLGATNLDWNTEIKPGPLEVGFDHAFIMAATGDRVPCVYVEDHRVAHLDPSDPIRVSYLAPFGDEPTGKTRPDLLSLHPSHGHDQTIVRGISRIGFMTGGQSARWDDTTMSDTFRRKAEEFIGRHAGHPFFLYLALHEPHVPRVPHPRFAGKSGLGPRGDAILQADEAVGAVVDTIDRLGLAADTLVLFTSDNGAVLDDGYRDDAVAKAGNHRPNGPWRGGKYSKFEAGTRVPLLARWPGHIRPGTSAALVCQVDFPATLAALAGLPPDRAASPDGRNLLPVLLGDSREGRDHLVEQGQGLALRERSWKYIPAAQGSARLAQTGIETGNAPGPQLYDLEADPGETRNLAAEQAERVARLAARLEALRRGPP